MLHVGFPNLDARLLFISSLEAVVETQGESESRPSSATSIPCTVGELKEKFFRVRALFSECHCHWSVSGQMDPESFASFLPVRPGGGDTPDGQKVHVLFRALRCGESDEDKQALNFSTKIAAEGVRIEQVSNDSPDTPASTLSSNPRKRKYEKGVRSASDEEGIFR
jgi:hypothetical protein